MTEALIQFSTVHSELSFPRQHRTPHTLVDSHPPLASLAVAFLRYYCVVALITHHPTSVYLRSHFPQKASLPPTFLCLFFSSTPELSPNLPKLKLTTTTTYLLLSHPLAFLLSYLLLQHTCIDSSKERPFRLNIFVRLAQLTSCNTPSSIFLQLLKWKSTAYSNRRRNRNRIRNSRRITGPIFETVPVAKLVNV